MTPDEVYIIIAGSTKALHWLPHFILDTLLLQDISYQTYVNGVAFSLHRNKKGLWYHFLLSMGVHGIKNFKEAKEKSSILSYFILKEFYFPRHDPQQKLKKHLQQVGFVWIYSHEDILPKELIQQQVLLKSRIPNQDQMVKIYKEAKR